VTAAPTAAPTVATAPKASTIPVLDLPSLHRRQHAPRSRFLVLVDPDGAMAAAIAKPRAVLAFAFVCLWALLPPAAFLVAAHQQGGLESVIVDEMKKSGAWEKISKLPAEKRAEVMRVTAPAMAVGLPVGAASKRAGWLLFVAAGCFLLLRGTSTRPIRLGEVVAVVAVGAAPLLVHDLLTAASYLSWELRSIDPQNAVASNPANLLFSGASSRSAVAVLLRGVDVFELWSCWLMGLGVARLTSTRSLTPWLVTCGGHAAITVFGALTSRIPS
jgi:hypothetical protein